MWKMIIGQAIFQLTATLILYFAGAKILNYDPNDTDQMLQLDTIIFNTFVWMQIFNEFNNRRLDNKFNIFEGVHRNQFFIFINCIMVGLQVGIIFVGSRAFQIHPDGLNGTQWAISILIALFCVPWGVAIRLFPDAWFEAIVTVVSKPFVVVFNALRKGWAKTFGALFHRKKKAAGDEEKVEVNEPGPMVIVSEAPRDNNV